MPPQWVVRSEVNGRENNEDSYHVFEVAPAVGVPPLTILAVADGMGGHAHGELVSREALRTISVSLFEQLAVEAALNGTPRTATPDAGELGRVLLGALEEANQHVRRMVETNRWGKAGSTAVIAAVSDDMAIVANLGDSPLFHYQAATGQLVHVTQDHTVAGVLLRTGYISPELARHHPGRSQLEFFVGAAALPREAPVYQVALAPGDLLLLCSDGISGAVLEPQIAAILADPAADLDAMADGLLRVSREAGETDNQTLILWRHQPPAATAAATTARRRSPTREAPRPGVAPAAFAAPGSGAPGDGAHPWNVAGPGTPETRGFGGAAGRVARGLGGASGAPPWRTAALAVTGLALVVAGGLVVRQLLSGDQKPSTPTPAPAPTQPPPASQAALVPEPAATPAPTATRAPTAAPTATAATQAGVPGDSSLDPRQLVLKQGQVEGRAASIISSPVSLAGIFAQSGLKDDELARLRGEGGSDALFVGAPTPGIDSPSSVRSAAFVFRDEGAAGAALKVLADLYERGGSQPNPYGLIPPQMSPFLKTVKNQMRSELKLGDNVVAYEQKTLPSAGLELRYLTTLWQQGRIVNLLISTEVLRSMDDVSRQNQNYEKWIQAQYGNVALAVAGNR